MTNLVSPHAQLSSIFPKGIVKGLIIFVFATVVSIALYHFLPDRLLSNDADFAKYGIHPRKGLAILLFIAILWLTEALHITITALTVPILAAFVHIPNMSTAQSLSYFGDPIIFLFFGGFALATALHVQKLDKKIALWLISLSGGHMMIAILLIFAVTAFLSMWISNTATTAMMLPLALGIMSNLDKEKDRNTFIFVLLGIAYSASIGGLGSIVGSPPNAIAAKELSISFAQWMRIGLPIMVILLPIMVGTLFVILRPKIKAQDMQSIKEDIPWNTQRIITMVLFISTAFAWIMSSQLKTIFNLTSQDTVIALIAIVFVVSLGLATWKQVSDNTDWGVLLLFGGGIALSKLLSASGASLVLGNEMATWLNAMSPLVIIIAVAIFIIILTEFTSNTASAALLVPVFASVATEMNMPAEVLVLIIGIGASCAFMLPVATPPNAIVFGTGLIKQRDMMRVGVVLNVFSALIVSFWAYMFWL